MADIGEAVKSIGSMTFGLTGRAIKNIADGNVGSSTLGLLGVELQKNGIATEAMGKIDSSAFGLAGVANNIFGPGSESSNSEEKVTDANLSSTVKSGVETGTVGGAVGLSAIGTTGGSKTSSKGKKDLDSVVIKLKNSTDKLLSIINDNSFSIESVKSKCNFEYVNGATIKCKFYPTDGLRWLEVRITGKYATPTILYPSDYRGYEESRKSNFNKTESAQFLQQKAEKIENKVKKIEGVIKNSINQVSSAGTSLLEAVEELQKLNISGVTVTEELAKAGEYLSSIK